MNRLKKKWIAGVLTSAALLISLSVFAGEETVIPLSDVPKKIMDVARAAMPDATFKTADIEIEADGTTVYEIQGTTDDGRKLEVDVFKSGEIEEIEVQFTKDLVPGAVLKAIKKKYPKFQITYIEASHSASKKVMKYEFEGNVNGKPLDLEVSADGRKIEVSDQ
jgi:hypothetical protein